MPRISLVCGFSSPSGVLVGLGLCAVAGVEFHGISLLRRLHPSAAKLLAINQLALAAILIAYALWNLYGGSSLDSLKKADPELLRMLGPIEGIEKMIRQLVYGSLIAIAVLAQGSMALYYLTRAKHIAAYRSLTPPWVLQMQGAGVML